jgi:probable HAF family extracellular repeat protein
VQVANCGFSQGYAINTSGQVIGYSNLASLFSPPIHAFLATRGVQTQDLGTLGAASKL